MTKTGAGRLTPRSLPGRAGQAASVLLLVALGAAMDGGSASAGAGYRCLLPNQPVADSAVGYKLRGSRCEGLYANLVDGEEGLWLVGFQTTSTAFNPQTDSSVRISVPGGVPGPLLLQVSSVAWRVHYGMDTDSLDRGAFDWSLDVFRNKAIGLGAEDIAAVACTNRCRRERTTMFVPVELRGPKGDAHKTAPTLILQAGVALSALYITVLHEGTTSPPDRPIGGTFLPAGRPIRLPLDDLLPGDNDVELIGVEKAGVDSRVSWRGHLLIPKR
jgi:hypothetical protein